MIHDLIEGVRKQIIDEKVPGLSPGLLVVYLSDDKKGHDTQGVDIHAETEEDALDEARCVLEGYADSGMMLELFLLGVVGLLEIEIGQEDQQGFIVHAMLLDGRRFLGFMYLEVDTTGDSPMKVLDKEIYIEEIHRGTFLTDWMESMRDMYVLRYYEYKANLKKGVKQRLN